MAAAANDEYGVLVYACIGASLVAWSISSIFGDYLNDEWGFWTAAMVFSYYRVHSLATVTETRPEAEESVPSHGIAVRPREVAS